MAKLIIPSVMTNDVIEFPVTEKTFYDNDSFFSLTPFYWFTRKLYKPKPIGGRVLTFLGRMNISNCVIRFEPNEIKYDLDLIGHRDIKKENYVFTINDTEYYYGGVLPLYLLDDLNTYECMVDYIIPQQR